MRMLGRFGEKLSYANIVATLALFIGLGGASYAAVSLPANSVGAKQIQPNAVGLGALDFPLGTVGFTNDDIKDPRLGRGCPTPPLLCGPAPQPIVVGREVHDYLLERGRLLVSAIVGLSYAGPVGDTAHVKFWLDVDKRHVVEELVTITVGQALQVPLQALASVSSGRHSVAVEAFTSHGEAEYGQVILRHVSLIATALPAGVGSNKPS
jgi:hypothetical protein